MNKTLVIAHRGASGYRPEHSLAAYELAFELGAEAVEPDVVLTKDGVPLLRHDVELSETSDVAELEQFADRKTVKELAGYRFEGWFAEDFSWEELQLLSCRERIPEIRPLNNNFSGGKLLRLGELVQLLHEQNHTREASARIKLVLELKHASYYRLLGFDLAAIIVQELSDYGWSQEETPLIVESFELPILEELRPKLAEAELVFLAEANGAPLDELLKSSQTKQTPKSYAEFLSEAGLAELSTKVDGVSLDKNLILPRDESGVVVAPTKIVDQIHRAGLKAYCWTLRPENEFLATNYQNNWEQEFEDLLKTGLDGVFADHPDLALKIRAKLEK